MDARPGTLPVAGGRRPWLREGLWSQNPALVQLLGLCPLLAISTTAVAALGLGLATAFALAVSALSVSMLRAWIPAEVRLPAFVVIIACAVTAAELLMQAYSYELHRRLGLFVPLIVTNCVVLARVELCASRERIAAALGDALAMGLGFAVVLVALGTLRELLGTGCVLGEASLLLPVPDERLRVCIGSGDGMLLAVSPPGAFLGLAFLVVLRNRLAGPAASGSAR